MRVILKLLPVSILIFSTLLPRAQDRKDLLLRKHDSLSISTPDSFLVSLFHWAKQTSLGYVGNPNDPVGPWYEAALPKREAFCIRDVSHQSIGAEILGLSAANKNMMRKFVENISPGKDHCSFWEINRYNKPAPVDYASDDDFWYNLNANFDLVDASYKLYQWTGDVGYVSDPVFTRFFSITLNEYLEKWQLQPDKIMKRPPMMNLRPGTVKYREARGIPSYDEGQSGITVSGDLVGMIANAFQVYARILDLNGDAGKSQEYAAKGAKYQYLLNEQWWDPSAQSFFGFYKTDGKFYHGGVAGSEFIMWYDIIRDPVKVEKSLSGIRNTQIEVLSYLPYLFYRNGLKEDAYGFLQKVLADPRRNYPEGAFSAIESLVRGTMGIEADATNNTITTCPRLTKQTDSITMENIPILGGRVSVRHLSNSRTEIANRTDRPFVWRAKFEGQYTKIIADGKPYLLRRMKDRLGHVYSYVELVVPGKSQVEATAVR